MSATILTFPRQSKGDPDFPGIPELVPYHADAIAAVEKPGLAAPEPAPASSDLTMGRADTAPCEYSAPVWDPA
jgi:hypothetical protein